MGTVSRAVRTGLARLIGERQGNVAILFGLALIPGFGAIGLAVDYSRASNARSFLQGAADSAALTALTKFEAEESARFNSQRTISRPTWPGAMPQSPPCPASP